MDLGIAGQGFLVTGGSSGIGLATARLLLQEGAQVTICARNHQRLDDAATLLASDHLRTIAADVTSADDCARAVEVAVEHAGRLDGIAALAGRGRHGTLMDLSPAEVAAELHDKTVGLLHPIHAGIGPLREAGGRVVALTAPTALEPDPAMAAVSAGRAALDSLVRSLALELADTGVRVNAVGVGLIDTQRQQDRYTNDPPAGDTSYQDWLTQQAQQRGVPMGRAGSAEEVAAAIVWLLSRVASYTTGAVVDVTGGLRSR